jgi:hypothetical protein
MPQSVQRQIAHIQTLPTPEERQRAYAALAQQLEGLSRQCTRPETRYGIQVLRAHVERLAAEDRQRDAGRRSGEGHPQPIDNTQKELPAN